MYMCDACIVGWYSSVVLLVMVVVVVVIPVQVTIALCGCLPVVVVMMVVTYGSQYPGGRTQAPWPY